MSKIYVIFDEIRVFSIEYPLGTRSFRRTLLLTCSVKTCFSCKVIKEWGVKKYTYTFAITKIIESTKNYEHFGCTNNVEDNWLKLGVRG